MNIKTFRLTQASAYALGVTPSRWRWLVCLIVLSWAPLAIAQIAPPDVNEAAAEASTEAATEESQPRDGVELLDGIQRSLDGPDVVITAGKDRTVFEYSQAGQLRLVKIVPRLGRPYYLVPADPTRGFGDLNQAGTLLPQWTIIEF